MTALDGLILGGIVVLALRVLFVRDLMRAVISFMVLGLFMALAWARLKAPDIALAEAALGAGIAGVLFLDAAKHLSRRSKDGAP